MGVGKKLDLFGDKQINNLYFNYIHIVISYFKILQKHFNHINFNEIYKIVNLKFDFWKWRFNNKKKTNNIL